MNLREERKPHEWGICPYADEMEARRISGNITITRYIGFCLLVGITLTLGAISGRI